MGDSSVSDGRVEAVVGTIVWVRRRNGSWWPGRIISEEELLTANLLSPRSGTPVKLLGREDGSVDWYNIEKSKRVKAFRCGDFEECIERAKALAGHSGKRREKYARREDAILDALELEKQQLGSQASGLPECSKQRGMCETSSIATGNIGIAMPSESRRAPCYPISHFGRSRIHHSPEIPKSYKLAVEAVTRPSFEWNAQKQDLELDDEKFESTPRMRGLQDFGLKIANVHGKLQSAMLLNPSGSRCTETSNVTNTVASCGLEYDEGMAAHWKRKRSSGGSKDLSSKRRDRKKPLMQVLESSAKLSETTESLSSLRGPQSGDKSSGEGNQFMFEPPSTDLYGIQESNAVSMGLDVCGYKSAQTQPMLFGSLEMEGSSSARQFPSSLSITGSKSSTSCTYHGNPYPSVFSSIDKYSSNTEPPISNNLPNVVSECKGDEGSWSVQAMDKMGSTGLHLSIAYKGSKPARGQNVALFPVRQREEACSGYVNHSDHKSCQTFEDGSERFMDEVDKLHVKRKSISRSMLHNRAEGECDSEYFGLSSKSRCKRHWISNSQDFSSGTSQDLELGTEINKGVTARDSRAYLKVNAPGRDPRDMYFLFDDSETSHLKRYGVNQSMSKEYADVRKDEQCMLLSALAKKPMTKVQYKARDLFSQSQKHLHRSHRGVLSSMNEPHVVAYSPSLSFKYADAGWFHVQVDTLAKSQKASVPMVLLASKLNRKPIIGYPVVVEVAEPNKLDTSLQGEGAVYSEMFTEYQPVWRTGRRTARQRGRQFISAVVDIEARETCKSTSVRHAGQHGIAVSSESGSKSIGRPSLTPLSMSHNVKLASKPNALDRKKLESLHKVALSKKVLRRVRLSSRKTRTRTLSSIAEEQGNRLEKPKVQSGNEKSVLRLAGENKSWIKRCRFGESHESCDAEGAIPMLNIGNCMKDVQHSMSEGQAQLPVLIQPTAPVATCVPVRVALERLKSVVCEDPCNYFS